VSHDSSPMVLFPHTFFREREWRLLSVLVPEPRVLRVLDEPAFPPWAGQRLAALPALMDSKEEDEARALLQSYRELARIHGSEGILESLSRQWHAEATADESRQRIEAELKGRRPAGIPPEKRMRLEAAVFLELARELDEGEEEIGEDFSRSGGVESRLRDALGIREDEEKEEGEWGELVEIATPSLSYKSRQYAFMTSRRLRAWYRVFAPHWGPPAPVPVAVVGDVAEELLEPFRESWERKPDAVLGAIPSPEALEPEDFRKLLEDLQSSGVLDSWWKRLAEAARHPDDASLRGPALEAAEALRRRMTAFCSEADLPAGSPTALKMACAKQATHADLWRKVDRKGYEALGSRLPPMGPAVVLYLEG